MATPGEFAEILAKAVGVLTATVVTHDRNLVKAGLRSKAGHGRGSAHITARDAAHILTAVLGSAQVRDSVATVKRYSATGPLPSASSAKGWRKLKIAEMAALSPEHSFIDALEALLAAAASGSLAAALGDDDLEAPGLIEVAALAPGTIGDIRIAGLSDEMTVGIRYAEPSPWDRGNASRRELAAWESRMKKRKNLPDLEQYRRITARTIASIGAALR